jgi:hypothetical protein
VPVPCFLLFLCFRKVTQEIFSELDETKARSPDIYRSFQRTKEETERSNRAASPLGGAAQGLAAPPYCDDLKFDNKFEVPVMQSVTIPESLL